MPSRQEPNCRRERARDPDSVRRASAGDRAANVRLTSSESLSVTPACEGVYVYTVPASSEWTTTDLLCILQDLVRSPSCSNSTADGFDGTR
jgi:hypothetical protein